MMNRLNFSILPKILSKLNKAWLLSPWLIFLGVFSGAFVGVFDRELAVQLLPFGSIYLRLLHMLVLPMLITAVISGLGNLFVFGMGKPQIMRFSAFLIGGLIVASLIGVSFGVLGHTGSEMHHDKQVTLGKTINHIEHSNNVNRQINNTQSSIYSLVKEMIPENIFYSLGRGDNLAILFFSILTGIGMGMLDTEASKTALTVVHAFYNVFLTIIGWMMYLLPFGLFCLFAGQIAQVGTDIIWATAKLIQYIYIACIATMVIYSLVIWWYRRHGFSYLQTLSALKQPIAVALGSASSFATIPTSISALSDNLKVNPNISDLVIPLGTTINPPASVLQFALSSIFIAQIYCIDLSFDQLLVVFFGAIMAGLASTTSPSIVALSMIAIILDPLGLPSGVAVILLVAIDPVVDPIVTSLNVYSNCALAVVMDEDEEVILIDNNAVLAVSRTD